MVFTVNKQKLILPLVGQLAEVSGQPKPNNGTIKLQDAKAVDSQSIPAGDPGRRLLDARMYKTQGSAQLYEKIRHELAMMPYLTEYDFISFSVMGSDVILSGWTVRSTNRSTAYNIVKDIPGVETVVNNIEELPLGRMDNQIRARARAALQPNLSRYFWGSGSAIKIIVRNGNIILLGVVQNKGDSDIAFMRCNSIPGAFKVFNLLQVESGKDKGA
jgi:osmotically-inducible protein OsmY